MSQEHKPDVTFVQPSAMLPVKMNFPNTLEGHTCYCMYSGGQQKHT